MRYEHPRQRALSFAATMLVLAGWEYAGRVGWVDVRFFPVPSNIVIRLGELLRDASFVLHVAESIYRLAFGSLIAIPLAVFLGLAIELDYRVSALLRPWVWIFYPMPKLALFPLLLLVFGIGDASKIAMIALGVFFLVLLNTMEGVRRLIGEGYLDLVKIFRIPVTRTVISIFLKGALPEILAGIKLGVGYGLVMVVASEFTYGRNGIGVFIWNSWDQFRILDLFAGLLTISLLGFLGFYLVELFRRQIKWIRGGNA